MIDIGANLTHGSFADDLEDVCARARDVGVMKMVVTGTSVAESRTALTLADGRELFATAGVHPHDADGVTGDWVCDLRQLTGERWVVAVGETGLDFHRNYSARENQEAVFRAQLELAAETQLPVFVHDRESEGRTRDILGEFRGSLGNVVVHCFTGTDEELDGYLEDGYHIGITGWICDERRGLGLREQVRRIPADRLLIETDAPYLLPRTVRPKPTSRRNEPGFLPWVARMVAECRGETEAAVAETTARNAERFFPWQR